MIRYTPKKEFKSQWKSIEKDFYRRRAEMSRGVLTILATPLIIIAGIELMPILIANGPQALNVTKTAFTISREGARARFAYSATSEVFNSISQTGGLGDVNIAGILGDTFLPNFGGELLTSTFEFNYNDGFVINSFSDISVNLGVGRVNNRLHSYIGKWSNQLGGQGAIKGLEHVFNVGSSITTGTFANYLTR